MPWQATTTWRNPENAVPAIGALGAVVLALGLGLLVRRWQTRN